AGMDDARRNLPRVRRQMFEPGLGRDDREAPRIDGRGVAEILHRCLSLVHAARAERMVGMRIRRRPVAVPVAVVMIVIVVMMIMVVIVMVLMRADANPFHMMMMALLRRAGLRFEAQDLGAILAHLALHRLVAI